MDNKCAGWIYFGHLKNYKNWNFSRTIKMDFIEQYFSRSQEIIGDRTQTEIRYDNEVVFVKYHINGLSANMSLQRNRANPSRFEKF